MVPPGISKDKGNKIILSIRAARNQKLKHGSTAQSAGQSNRTVVPKKVQLYDDLVPLCENTFVRGEPENQDAA